MMIPTVHLNGTGKENLLGEIRAAVEALELADKAVRQITVHGRDYYVQSPEAYRTAREEMDARLVALGTVRDELVEMWRAIQSQGR